MSPDLTIHHICGLDGLAEAPLTSADRIVSILGPGEPAPPELVGLRVPILALRFDDVILPDRGFVEVTARHVDELIAFDAGAREDERLVVHCAAGVSRSTAATAVLLAARHRGHEDAIFAAIRRMRPQAWPNARVVALGDARLGRGGALVAALLRSYEATIASHPELAPEMPGIRRAIALAQAEDG